MRVLVTGATGFIGRVLVEKLVERGDAVTGLTRRVRDGATFPGALAKVRWVVWEPTKDGAWQREVAEHDAVVHLAGEQAAGRRLTPERKNEILQSRVESTRRVVRGMERGRPAVFVCASGVGFYGGHADGTPLEETAPAGDDFLARVCVAWEAAAREAEALGVRVVSARIGFVLGRDGGALAKMVPIFKAFVGGPLGSGRQSVSWIHVEDVARAILKAIDDERIAGPMNVTGPAPVTNAAFSKALGRALGRPAILPAPAFALKALFGEGADAILTGQAAVPRVLLDHGFRFRFTELDAALADAVGR